MDSLSTTEFRVLHGNWRKSRGGKKVKETIGQRILAAVISYQLDIGMDRAMKLYVRNRQIHSSWEEIGEKLLERHAETPPAQAPS